MRPYVVRSKRLIEVDIGCSYSVLLHTLSYLALPGPDTSGREFSISTICCITSTTQSWIPFGDGLYGFRGQNASASVTPDRGPAKCAAANLVGAIPSLQAFSACATKPCSFMASCTFPSFHRAYSLATDLGKTLPIPVTQPDPPPLRQGISQSDEPA